MRNFAFYFILIVLIFSLLLTGGVGRVETEDYSRFFERLENGEVYEMTLSEKEIQYKVKDEWKKTYRTSGALDEGDLKRFREKSIDVTVPAEESSKDPTHLERIRIRVQPRADLPWWAPFAGNTFLVLIFLFPWLYFMQRLQSSSTKAASFGKSRARFLDTSKKRTLFTDVAGAEEAKDDLQEIISFLRHPKRFQKIGARIPRGVLLVGPPGTGKTLLARAVAGEANVPFLHISGSDFVEMFVGVGASRVRDLFEQGKKHAPCLLFIDEIDAVGRQRGAGLGGGHDEREQTLNQLLVEMDGFESNEGLILLAATNRPDVLDPALLRPGRFDRQIFVDLPDVVGREGIFKVHLHDVPHEENIEPRVLARATPGFSGADISNMVNEAALRAARYDRSKVAQTDLEHARDKVLMGPERKSRIITDQVKEKTAWHEAGHALVARLVGQPDEVHKISVIPRGRALGVTSFLPDEVSQMQADRVDMEKRLASLMGGRVAEEVQFGVVSAGASDDIRRASEIARRMVCEFGMSDALGPVNYSNSNQAVFLGREIQRERSWSEATASLIDEEVKRFVTEAYDKARHLLTENKDLLERVSVALIEREVLSGSDLDLLIEGKELPPMVEPEALPVEDAAGKEEAKELAEKPVPGGFEPEFASESGAAS